MAEALSCNNIGIKDLFVGLISFIQQCIVSRQDIES